MIPNNVALFSMIDSYLLNAVKCEEYCSIFMQKFNELKVSLEIEQIAMYLIISKAAMGNTNNRLSM